MGDTALWAAWYDLPEQDGGAYLEWLHGEYLPQLAQRPGYTWVAHYAASGHADDWPREIADLLARVRVKNDSYAGLGLGTQYVLVVGAAGVAPLVSPDIEAREREEVGRAREFLDMRLGVRTALFVEMARGDGPEAGRRTPGTAPGPVIQMGTLRLDDAGKDAIGSYYVDYKLPSVARTAGCVGMRVLTAVRGWPDLGVIYEFTSLEERRRHFLGEVENQALQPEQHPIAASLTPHMEHAPGSPTVATRTWPA